MIVALLASLPLVIIFLRTQQITTNHAQATTPPAIHIQGDKFIDENGQQVLLHGVVRTANCSGASGIFSRPADASSIQIMKNWHINAVFLDVSTTCWLNTGQITPTMGGATYQKALTDYATLLAQNNIYIIFRINSPSLADHQTVVSFWTQIADTFKNNPVVLFEVADVYPSSNKDTPSDWECWRDGTTQANQATCVTILINKRTGISTTYTYTGLQDIVTTIRSTGAKNIIVLHGINGINSFMNANYQAGVPESLTGWLQFKPTDPLNSIASGIRVYHFDAQTITPCDQASCWNGMIAPVSAQVPLIDDYLTERNFLSTGTSCDAAWMNTYMDWLDMHSGSYIAAFWDTAGTQGCNSGTYNLLLDNNGTPSILGKIFKDHIAGITTNPPSVSLSPTQTPIVTPTPTPSISVTTTPTLTPSATVLDLTICPHGLGNCGDNVSSLGGNTAPSHPTRDVLLSLTDANNNPVSGSPFPGHVTYVTSAQNFQGPVTIPNVPNGQYLVTVKMNGFLSKQISGIITVFPGRQIVLPSVSLVTGDITNDDQVDIQDYNALFSCFGAKVTTSSCVFPPTLTSPGADILDDGPGISDPNKSDPPVDGGDYTQFLRELSTQRAQ